MNKYDTILRIGYSVKLKPEQALEIADNIAELEKEVERLKAELVEYASDYTEICRERGTAIEEKFELKAELAAIKGRDPVRLLDSIFSAVYRHTYKFKWSDEAMEEMTQAVKDWMGGR